jgi:hypothetical protein
MSSTPTPAEDAKALRNALNVMISANEQKLYSIISHRTNEHMAEVGAAYKAEFKRNLISDIKVSSTLRHMRHATLTYRANAALISNEPW